MVKKGIKLIFEPESGLFAEKITVYEGPLEKGKAFIVENEAVFLPEAAAGSVYSYELNREDSYIYTGVVEFTEEEAARGEKVVRYDLARRRENGFETAFVSRWTEAVETRCFNMNELRRFDKSVPNTPAFSPEKGEHQFTSTEEACSFLKKVCAACSGVYLYELKAQGGCPAVIFTKEDLSGRKSLEEAMEKLAADGRIKALYQAQLHGNEPASGEGALAVIRALAESSCEPAAKVKLYSEEACRVLALGEKPRSENSRCASAAAEKPHFAEDCGGDLTENMDIIIVPFVNESGSREFSRWETVCGENGDCEKIDLNRDALLLRAEVTRAVHHIFCTLMPEIFIDGHEFSGRKRQVREEKGRYILDSLDDIQITCVDHLNRDRRIFDLENRIMLNSIDALSAKGFRSFFFPASLAQNTSCGYARLMYALTFLVESNGIRRGKLQYERRVLSQREAVLEILRNAAEKAGAIKTEVSAAREEFIKRGGCYALEDEFVLEQKIKEEREFERPRKSFDFAGNIIDENRRISICNRGEAVRSRIRPAAYLLPKDCPGAERAAEILSANGAVYEELEEGETVCVKKYLRRNGAVVLNSAENHTFETGAFVFSLSQMAANVISASLEPDLGDVTERNGSFVQAGILPWNGEACPVYRLAFQEKSDAEK